METVISALISAAAALIVSLYTVHVQEEKSIAIIELKIEELSKKVDKHNTIIERTYELEKLTGIQDEQITTLKEDLKEIKEKGELHNE